MRALAAAVRLPLRSELARVFLLGRLISIGKQVPELGRIIDADERHLVARNERFGVGQVFAERVVVPDDVDVLHRRRIGVAGHGRMIGAGRRVVSLPATGLLACRAAERTSPAGRQAESWPIIDGVSICIWGRRASHSPRPPIRPGSPSCGCAIRSPAQLRGSVGCGGRLAGGFPRRCPCGLGQAVSWIRARNQ
jgi:hypothetical protein